MVPRDLYALVVYKVCMNHNTKRFIQTGYPVTFARRESCLPSFSFPDWKLIGIITLICGSDSFSSLIPVFENRWFCTFFLFLKGYTKEKEWERKAMGVNIAFQLSTTPTFPINIHWPALSSLPWSSSSTTFDLFLSKIIVISIKGGVWM